MAQSLLKQVSLGRKLLLPREILQELNRLESAARSNLARYSLDSALGPFVPAAAFRRFKVAHNELAIRYLAVRDDILVRLDEIRGAVVANFAQAASDLYPTVARHVSVDRETFIAEYVDRAMDLYPLADRIRASFYFDYEVSYIPLSSEVLAEETQRAAIVRDEQLREELVRHVAQRKQAEIDDFLTSIVQQLRKTVYDAVTSALTSLRARGTVPPRTLGRLRKLVEQVRLLNVYGDADVDAYLRELEGALGNRDRKIKFIPPARVEQVLVDLQQVTRDAVGQAFAVEPLLSRFASIDLDGPGVAPPAESLAPRGMDA